jgi:thymidine kinase
MALILCHGGMCSGKSDLAAKIVRSYSRYGLSRVLYQPRENTRDVIRKNEPRWFSRSGGEEETTTLKARWYSSAEEVLAEKDNFDVFGFEEWHLFNPEVYNLIKTLDDAGKIVVAAGGDYYFNGEPVEIFERLRKIKGARLLQGVEAFCQECSDRGVVTLASRTQRTCNSLVEAFDAPKIVVEGVEGYSYSPVCLEHWKVNPPVNPEKTEDYKRHYLLPKGIIVK